MQPSNFNKTWIAYILGAGTADITQALQAKNISRVGENIDLRALERALHTRGISDRDREEATQKLQKLEREKASYIESNREILARFKWISGLSYTSAILCTAGAQSSNPLIKYTSYAGMTLPVVGFFGLQGIGSSLTNKAKDGFEKIAKEEALKLTKPAFEKIIPYFREHKLGSRITARNTQANKNQKRGCTSTLEEKLEAAKSKASQFEPNFDMYCNQGNYRIRRSAPGLLTRDGDWENEHLKLMKKLLIQSSWEQELD